MSWGGKNPIPGWLGMGESNSLVKMGLVPNFNSAEGILAPGMRVVTEDIPNFFKQPGMPAVSPAAESVEDTSALKAAARAEAARLRKRQGLKSTILTGSDQSLMTPAQTEKAQALG